MASGCCCCCCGYGGNGGGLRCGWWQCKYFGILRSRFGLSFGLVSFISSFAPRTKHIQFSRPPFRPGFCLSPTSRGGVVRVGDTNLIRPLGTVKRNCLLPVVLRNMDGTSWGTGWWWCPNRNFLKRNAENLAQDDDYDDDVDD